MSVSRSARPPGCGPRRSGRAAGPSLLAFAVFAALVSSCRGGFDPRHPDIVLIVVDTLRADHLGAYGYERGTTPHLDALARQGTVFDAAWSAAPWTLPSVMSIMTSRYPSSHRVENDGLKLGADTPTLAEALQRSGYSTAAFVSHVYVSAPFGFGRGFETFEDFGLSRPGYRLEAGMEPRADRVTDSALAWLDRQGRKPVFLFVHYFDPHWPYDPPEKFRPPDEAGYHGPLDAAYDSISKFLDPRQALPEDYRAFLLARYDGEIRFVDEQIGRLLDRLSTSARGARAWVIVTADHGEEFKDHGSMGHGRRLYEEVVRVPLIIRRPGKAGAPGGGARVGAPVSGIDLFPTLAAAAGAPPPAAVQGTSLLHLLERPGPSPPADRPLVCETIRLNAHLKAVRVGSLKLIQSMDENRAEMYDLAADPREARDLAGARPEDRKTLARALFSRVDYLSGGWNVRWSSDGGKRRFHGQIRTPGIFRTVVPLFREAGTYTLEAPGVLNFSDVDQTGWSGLSFTTAPEDAGAEFYLLIDGRQQPERIFLGGNANHPRTLPFPLEGRPSVEAAFAKPPGADGRELGYFIWRLRPAAPDQEVVLDDEIRERLRSLGYVN